MDIQTLGNLGEFIGSIAVLVTLGYLAIQTRQTVTIAKQTSLSDILERRQELMNQLMDRDFIEVWGKGCARLQLDALDAQRFTSFAISFLSHVQDVYIQYKAGLIDEKVWEAERRLMVPGLVGAWPAVRHRGVCARNRAKPYDLFRAIRPRGALLGPPRRRQVRQRCPPDEAGLKGAMEA